MLLNIILNLFPSEKKLVYVRVCNLENKLFFLNIIPRATMCKPWFNTFSYISRTAPNVM